MFSTLVQPPKLPESAQVVADIIGVEATLKLAGATLRRGVYIPHDMPKDHWIPTLIGWAKAKALHDQLRGMDINLATCGDYYRARRNQGIRDEFKAGASTTELAARHKLTVQRIRAIVSDLQA